MKLVLPVLQNRQCFINLHLPQKLPVEPDAGRRGKEDQLGGAQRLGHFDRYRVRVQAKGVPLAVATQRRHHRHDIGFQKRFQQRHVDALDAAGPHLIDAFQNPGRVGHQGIGAGAAQVVHSQPFQNFVADAVGGRDGKIERDFIGDAGAVGVRGRFAGLGRKLLNLQARAMNQHHADAQAAQQVNVQEQVREIVVGNDGAIQRDHEDLVPELRHVPQDFAQVGEFFHAWSEQNKKPGPYGPGYFPPPLRG